MNKTKKKGFTLVELLAVIVILAVVILIAVTAVVPRMNNAKQKAFIDETMVYMKAAKEAYVTDPSTECYNISEMSSLVKQSKAGYSGTVYANDGNVSINITNGKYYVKTSDNPSTSDIVTTKPSDFISSCNEDNVPTYTLTYELNGGNVSEENPSQYDQNTPTITLNNPTKSGYRFVGWSSKNMIDVNNVIDDYYLSNTTALLVSYLPDVNGNKWSVSDFIEIEGGKTYTFNPNSNPGSANVGHCFFNSNKEKTSCFSSGLKTMTSTSDSKYIRVSYRRSNSSNVQLEEGSSATNYQEYMEPTTSAKIYRGSMGNKKFIANWEAI